MLNPALALAAAAVLLLACDEPGAAQPEGDEGRAVWAAGSSTVFPFASRVAENYASKTGDRAPRIESLDVKLAPFVGFPVNCS